MLLASTTFSMIHPENWGRFSHFDEHMFSKGLVQPSTFACLKMFFLNLGISKVKSNSSFDVLPGLPYFMCGSSGNKGLLTYDLCKDLNENPMQRSQGW